MPTSRRSPSTSRDASAARRPRRQRRLGLSVGVANDATGALSAWLPVLVWAAVIFTLSSIPSLDTGLGGWDTLLRKGAHLTEYAILGGLLLRALGQEVPAVVVGALYAVTDELHQSFVRGRHASPLDFLLDTAGVALGVYALHRLFQTRLVPGTRHGR
jgi:VanZ family protein